MATARSEQLRAVAQRVTDALPPAVTDVVLTGSTSRGVADEHSDVELLVVAEELPELPQAVVPLDDAASWDNPGDALVLARRVIDDAEHILPIVFALNASWEPGWKRLALILEPLAVKPPQLAERIDAAVRTLDLRASRRLADEALALAPQTPKVARARACLAELE